MFRILNTSEYVKIFIYDIFFIYFYSKMIMDASLGKISLNGILLINNN